MGRHRRRAWGWWSALVARCRSHRSVVWLVVGVVAFWLVLFGLVTLALPPRSNVGARATFDITVGGVAHVYAPPLQTWPIPTDRATYEDYQRAVRESDEGGITDVIARPGWVSVADREAVQVVTVDGDAVQVEVVGGQHAGERGWLLARQLRP